MRKNTVVENPRRISHEESFERETINRLNRYGEIKTAVCDSSTADGMKAMGFSDKEIYKQFRAAFYLACLAHANQTDKGGVEYICHPATVALHVRDHYPKSKKRDRTMVVALLHDIIEDTSVTEDALRAFGFEEKIVKTVLLLSRHEEDSYDSYIEKLAVSRMAMKIKCADMTDNENLSRIPHPSPKDVNRSAGYHTRRLYMESQLRGKKEPKVSGKEK